MVGAPTKGGGDRWQTVRFTWADLELSSEPDNVFGSERVASLDETIELIKTHVANCQRHRVNRATAVLRPPGMRREDVHGTPVQIYVRANGALDDRAAQEIRRRIESPTGMAVFAEIEILMRSPEMVVD